MQTTEKQIRFLADLVDRIIEAECESITRFEPNVAETKIPEVRAAMLQYRDRIMTQAQISSKVCSCMIDVAKGTGGIGTNSSLLRSIIRRPMMYKLIPGDPRSVV